ALVNEVLGHIERSTLEPREIFDEEKPHLVLQNCLLNLETLQKEEFCHDYYALNKMHVVYDPTKDYKESLFWKFINEILTPEDVDGVQEEVGQILYKRYLVKKLSIWEGDTDTGKTTLINAIISFVGKDNVVSFPLHELSERNRFSVGRLYGKMANIVDDMPRDIIHSVGKLKELTGRSRVQGEFKFQDQFDFTSCAYQISACNKLPPVEEDDEAFWNRVVLRAFRKKFGGKEKPDTELINKITTPEELSRILNWALEGLDRLKRNGWSFSNTKTIEDVREEYKRRSDPIWAFATYCLDTSDGEAYEPKEDLYNWFKKYCEKHGLPNPGKDYFYKHLGDRVTVTSFRPEVLIDGKKTRPHSFKGIKLTDKAKSELDGEKGEHGGRNGQNRRTDVQGVQGSLYLRANFGSGKCEYCGKTKPLKWKDKDDRLLCDECKKLEEPRAPQVADKAEKFPLNDGKGGHGGQQKLTDGHGVHGSGHLSNADASLGSTWRPDLQGAVIKKDGQVLRRCKKHPEALFDEDAWEEHIMQEHSGNEKNRIGQKPSFELAIETWKQLEGPQKSEVEDKAFIEALVKTGKFNDDEADKMLKTFYQSGQVYETKPGYFRKIW
ncbi:MAG: phage/plasmid primase, P4 family, partial [Nitrososphaerales archaeon]